MESSRVQTISESALKKGKAGGRKLHVSRRKMLIEIPQEVFDGDVYSFEKLIAYLWNHAHVLIVSAHVNLQTMG